MSFLSWLLIIVDGSIFAPSFDPHIHLCLLRFQFLLEAFPTPAIGTSVWFAEEVRLPYLG